nr:hypothetical protein [Bacteroides sp.]
MYDEQEAIQFIRTSTGSILDCYDDDQILNIIDIVWDWQEANGYLEIDADDDDEIDVAALTDHAVHLLRKDKGNEVKDEHVRLIVEAELEFEDSL